MFTACACVFRARRADELFGQQTFKGVLPIAERLGLLGLQAMALALHGKPCDQRDHAYGKLGDVEREQA
ncbi:hypothetical protein A6E19_08955 [Pseudomonas putida]|nr:hypothetical protein A6E23_06830 [Pseudomonas putida]OCT39666.1 hypothetical protein A6E19_08955 [Pseudomonas putida]